MNREAIMTALFNQVSNTPDFAIASRKFQLWNEVGSADKPALFLKETKEDYKRTSEAVPATVMLHVDMYVNVDAPKDSDTTAATDINNLLDAIDTALAPDALSGTQTLGGLVSHCWIEGEILKNGEDVGGDGLVVVPVRVLCVVG